MGKGNDHSYLTLEESSRALGKPVSWIKDVICRGELGGILVGRQWLIAAQGLEKLRLSLPHQPEEAVHNFSSDRPPLKQDRIRKPAQRPNPEVPRRAYPAGNRNKELELMDAEVRSLAAQVEVGLVYLTGGKAIWNKLRKDNYPLSAERRKSLPKNLVNLLEDLQRTKGRYITLRETDRYKKLLRSLPEWNPVRAAWKVKVAQVKRSKSAPVTIKPVHIGGIKGYYAGDSLAKKRFWFNEED